MAVIALVLVIVCICLGLLWKEERAKNQKLVEELTFTKETISTLFSKPIYAAITDKQIEHLGQLLASYLQPKEWLN